MATPETRLASLEERLARIEKAMDPNQGFGIVRTNQLEVASENGIPLLICHARHPSENLVIILNNRAGKFLYSLDIDTDSGRIKLIKEDGTRRDVSL